MGLFDMLQSDHENSIGSEEGSGVLVKTRGRWAERMPRILPTLILVYCILQPILDVCGYWQIELGVGNTFTLVIRMLLLAGSVLLGFLLSDRKRYYFITAGVLLALTALHVAANIPGGYTGPVTDLVNLVRIYLMPLTVLCFITFMRRGGKPAYRAMVKGLLINVFIIVIVEIISVLTGTGRETYVNYHIGVMGWFFWSNCQSAILSMMAPIVVCYSLKHWPGKTLPVLLFTLVAEAPLYFFGTRLTYAALIGTGIGVGVCLLLIDRRRWRETLVVLLITAVFACAYPVSPMMKRMTAVNKTTSANEQIIADMGIVEAPKDKEPKEEIDTSLLEIHELPPDDPNAPQMSGKSWANMRKIYKSYLTGLVLRFGYDRVMQKYNYTLDASILGNWRIEKLSFCELLMEESSPMCRLFGRNLLDMRVFVQYGVRNEKTGAWENGYLNFDVENDFHGVYFLLGIVGLVLMCAFLLYFGVRALICVINDFKTFFTIEMVGFAGAYVFGIVHAYFTVSVLRRNNASVYLALVLVGLWYLSQKKRADRSAVSCDQAA